MSVQLRSADGSEISLAGRYWSFFLCLAKTCEWKPAGTKKPEKWGFFKRWDGNYESSDGQQVTDSDAREFSDALNRCYYSKHCFDIMAAVAEEIESQIEAEFGQEIPAHLRINTSSLRDALGALMAMSHKGGFRIF
ncbi:hypothetical protein [Parachitinimonas caeni]|uniref:Uncharacterized protein n=1 Tax=Parachitinimonas caeni TaxID=3031301 RepID=A0ABT7E2K2_9NEIS|nr:hypothetical protein [Parachitinimonas caeni]MDK2126536.1 hypothetical protein [Parachitinimonas caeni]